MGLAAMMRLMIEQVSENFPKGLSLRHTVQRLIVPLLREVPLFQSVYKTHDPFVFRFPRSVQ